VGGFFERLKERKLVQWLLAYAAAAFALLQGLDIVAQRFGWPESIERGLIVALALGLLVTIVLAWYHGERGAQRVTGTELLILALLLAIGGGFLWRLSAAPQKVAEGPAQIAAMPALPVAAKSIAVLPLTDESGEKDQQYFSDGLSEDLITALSQFAGLKVIGRNSSFQFRDTKLPSSALGQALTQRGDVQAREGRARRRQRAADIDGAAGVLDDGHGKVLSPRVFGRVADAEVEGEPGHEDPPQAALSKISGEAGLRSAVVLVECRVGIDLAVKALAQHKFRMGNLQLWAQFGARRSLHAMVRP